LKARWHARSNQALGRMGTIEGVEDVAGSDRLVVMRVNFGTFARQVVSGMKQERENPAEIVVRPMLAVPEGPVPNGARAG
jgi:tRNA-binding protein